MKIGSIAQYSPSYLPLNVFTASKGSNLHVLLSIILEDLETLDVDAYRPSQQLWSCRDVASSHGTCTQNKDVMTSKKSASNIILQLVCAFICKDGITKPLFLGRLWLELLTSNQMVSQ